MKIENSRILAYIKGELPYEAKKEYDSLMLSSPEFREAVNQTKILYRMSDTLMKQKEIDASTAWSRVSRRIKIADFRRNVWNFTRTAAAVILPLFLLYQFFIQPMLDPTHVEMITLSSAPGIVTKATLPDGSEVWLNAQSKLTYPLHFSGKERTVELSGEAYFKVISDPENRFNVKISDGFIVSAFGTQFNVNAYPDELMCQVTLAEGNVGIEATGAVGRTLLPGQKAVLMHSTGNLSVIETDAYVDTAWKDGKMVFRRENLETIAQKLSRKFGVIVVLKGEELKTYEYTATFTDESLEDILELLKLSAPIAYAISKQEQLENETFTQRVVTIRNR